MAFPTTGIFDNFDRANESPPTGWTMPLFSGSGGIRVLSNQLASVSGIGNGYWNTQYGPACEIYGTVAVRPGGTNEIDLTFRVQSPGTSGLDGYELICRPQAGTDVIKLSRIDNTAYTQLGATISQEFAAGDGFGVEAIGPNFTIYYKSGAGSWGSIGTRTDSTYAGAGYLAVEFGDGTGRWDNLGGGTLIVPLSVSGSVALTGAIIKSSNTNYAGSYSLAGNISYLISATYIGQLVPVGVLIINLQTLLNGVLGLSSIIQKVPNIPLLGTLGSSGSVVSQVNFILTSAIGLAGNLIKDISINLLQGTLGLSGTLSNSLPFSFSGAIGLSGSLIKEVVQTFIGSIVLSGSLLKNASTSFAGSIGLSSNLALLRVIVVAYFGGIALSGTVDYEVSKLLSRSISFVGTLTKNISIAYSGQLLPSGQPNHVINTVLLGTIALAGNWIGIIQSQLSGLLGITGNLTNLAKMSYSGNLGMVGTLVKSLAVGFSSSIGLSATLSNLRVAVLEATGSIGFSGILGSQISKVLSGSSGFVGNIIKQVNTAYQGQLTPSGIPNNLVPTVLSGVVSLASSLSNLFIPFIPGVGEKVSQFKGIFKGMFKGMK